MVSAMTETKKRCAGCEAEHLVSEFATNRTKPDGLQSQCRIARRRYAKAHYQKNRGAYLARASARRATITPENRARLWEYLSAHPCTDCGEADALVLEFDHIKRTQKKRGVAWLVSNSYQWATILAEIAKCEVVCTNCHRRRTARQFGWWASVSAGL